MADVTEKTPTFDLGIENSQVMGNINEAEAFLSDTVIKAKPGEELKEIDEEEELAKAEEAKQAALKKKAEKAPPKKSAAELGEDFFNTGDEEDEDPQEELDTNGKPLKPIVPAKKEETTEDKGNEFENFSKELYDLNVLTLDEEGQTPLLAKTGDDLLELLNKEKQKGAIAWLDNFLEQHGEDRRELFQAIFVNGVDPKTYLPVYNQLENLKGLSLEEEANQEKVVREFYKRAGIAEEKISTKIQRLKDSADLQTEAEDFHPQLVAQDEQRAKDIEEQAAESTRMQNEIETIYKASISKLISEKGKGKDYDGIPITPQRIQKAVDALQTKKWKTADGQLLTDFDKFILETKKPENIEKRLKIALLEEIGWDFSKIEKKAISKESNKLFNSLAQKEHKQQTRQPAPQTEW